jgi:hypothetical protein
MSPNTFICLIFGWMSAFQIDFRKGVDPWCGYSPKYLACDGTHIGVAVRHQEMKNSLEKVDVPEQCLQSLHKRYSRVLIPDKDARLHFRFLCREALGKDVDDEVTEAEFLLNSNHFIETLQGLDFRVQVLLTHFSQCTLSENVQLALASFLYLLSGDAAMSTAVPFPCHHIVKEICDNLSTGQCADRLLYRLRFYTQELVELFICAEREGGLDLVIDFVRCLLELVESIHEHDRPTKPAIPIQNTYNPTSGVAYYFTEEGEQVRQLGRYHVSGSGVNRNYDDPPQVDPVCNKDFPMVSRGGYGYMFLWFCSVHGHCYGLHLIKGGEGRKDPFTSLYKYLPNPPAEIFYDFACQLSEYCLNREPKFFQNTRFSHDIFHSFPHKCGPNFRSTRVLGLEGMNSEICEQWNSYLQCIKFTASHLTQTHMMFFLQFMLFLRNEEKTATFHKIAEVAIAGCE